MVNAAYRTGVGKQDKEVLRISSKLEKGMRVLGKNIYVWRFINSGVRERKEFYGDKGIFVYYF